MATGKMFYSMAKKDYKKWDLPLEKCAIDTFQTGLCDINLFWLHLLLALFIQKISEKWNMQLYFVA